MDINGGRGRRYKQTERTQMCRSECKNRQCNQAVLFPLAWWKHASTDSKDTLRVEHHPLHPFLIEFKKTSILNIKFFKDYFWFAYKNGSYCFEVIIALKIVLSDVIWEWKLGSTITAAKHYYMVNVIKVAKKQIIFYLLISQVVYLTIVTLIQLHPTVSLTQLLMR